MKPKKAIASKICNSDIQEENLDQFQIEYSQFQSGHCSYEHK